MVMMQTILSSIQQGDSDGHILLTRDQAQMGVYPAVDVTSSVSRVMNDIVGADHQQASRKFRRLVSLYVENRDLLLMEVIARGRTELDLAVSFWPALMNYIQQQENEKADFDSSRRTAQAHGS